MVTNDAVELYSVGAYQARPGQRRVSHRSRRAHPNFAVTVVDEETRSARCCENKFRRRVGGDAKKLPCVAACEHG